jgi:hypothetical protein
MRWFARCVGRLATLLLVSPLAASAQNVAVEVGANDFRISDMGPGGDERFYAVWPALAFHPPATRQLVVWYGDDNVSPLIDGEFEIFGQLLFVPEPSRSLMLVSGVAFLALLRRARERTKRCCCRR